MKIFRIITCALAAVLLLSQSVSAQGRFNVKFATKEQAQKYITEKDHYISGLSQFDIDSRVGKPGSTMEELTQLQMKECRDWTQAEKDTLLKAFSLIDKLLVQKGFNIPTPDEIVMVKTSMAEEGNAGGYTRENRIYLGERAFNFQRGVTAESLLELVAHELFHVLTRQDLNFKSQMYSTISFTRLKKEFKFGKDIMQRRISNPDVSIYDSYCMLTVDGVVKPFTMINVANAEYQGGSFFRYLEVGVIALNKKHKPVVKNGVTEYYPLQKVSDFYDKVGKNTGYVINPEECLADNFALAVIMDDTAKLPSPEIMERIFAVLKNFR